MNFETHGYFVNSVRDSIYLIHPHGSWNDLDGRALIDDMTEKTLQLQGSPWGIHVDLRDWALCTPDVWEMFKAFIPFMVARNLKFQAVVTCPETQIIQQHLMGDLFKEVPQMYWQVFTDEELAFQWCQEQLKRL